MQPIYLDNNATTQADPKVIEVMMPFLTEWYGNPSSIHTFGGKVAQPVEKARQQVADLLGATPGEILFTSGGTEADSTAIWSALQAHPQKRHLITTRVEHPAVLTLCRHLEKRGYEVTYLGVDQKGQLDLEELAAAIRPDTAIVSIMYANNETGTVFPMEKIAAIVKEGGSLLHTDAVQAVGKLPIDLKILPVDYLALSGHKLHAPKGIGVLYVRKSVPFRPSLRGGHQEHGRRAGTENVAAIVALGEACEIARQHMPEERTRVKELRDRLEQGLLAAIPDTIVNGDPESRLPNTSSISFKYIEGEAILLLMDGFGICASSGSACTSGNLEPSHVLRAMGVPFTYAHGSIRFSLSRFTTKEEIDIVLNELPLIIEKLRELSPFRKGHETLDPAANSACS